jgi:hypothetical protein
MYELIVKEPFGGYKKGERITNQATVGTVLAGESAQFVNKIAAPTGAPQKPQPPADQSPGQASPNTYTAAEQNEVRTAIEKIKKEGEAKK